MASSDDQSILVSTLRGGPAETQKTLSHPATAPASSTSPRSQQQTFILRAKQHLLEPVRPSLVAEIELLVLTFCTGIQDTVAFPEYHCFASNQTGNTVLLAMAVVLPSLDSPTFSTANTAIALSLFLAGAYLTGQLAHLVGPRCRLWLILCNALQTLLVAGAGDSAQPRMRSLALLAFASGSQVVQSRSLRMTEISTAMATAAWVDLLVDPRLMVVREGNRPRNRRLAFLAALVAGSLVGAAIYRTAGSAAAVLVSAGGKAIVTGMFFFNGAERDEKQEPV